MPAKIKAIFLQGNFSLLVAVVFVLCSSTNLVLAQNGGQIMSNGCYCRYTDMKLKCTSGFSKRSTSSEEECLAICTQNSGQCKSVNFEKSTATCEVFSVAPKFNMKRRRRSLFTFSNNFLPLLELRSKRQNNDACYGSDAQVKQCAGAYYYTPTGNCHAGYGGGGGGGPVTTTIPYPTTTQRPLTTTRVLPSAAQCPSGQQLRYLQQNGAQPSSSWSGSAQSIQATSPEQCLQSCTSNQTPCKAALFVANSNTCLLSPNPASSGAGSSLGTGNNQGTSYYEKICVDDSMAAQCPGPYLRVPQYALLGYARAVADAGTFGDCLNACLNAQSNMGFICNSGMMFYEDKRMNCVLNIETQGTHPDLFTPFNETPTDYFETKCLSTRAAMLMEDGGAGATRDILKINRLDWNAWSACDKRSNMRRRFRDCKSIFPWSCAEMEEENCNNAKNTPKSSAPKEFLKSNSGGSDSDSGGDVEFDAAFQDSVICNGVLKSNGELDCSQNGVQISADGERQSCVPDECRGGIQK